MSETSSKDNVKTAMTYICGGKLAREYTSIEKRFFNYGHMAAEIF